MRYMIGNGILKMSDNTLYKKDFKNIWSTSEERLQIAATIIRIFMMSEYGNMTYLASVKERRYRDGTYEYIGILNTAMQTKNDDGWDFIDPLENSGFVVLNESFQITEHTDRYELVDKLREEYRKRGL